MLFKVRRQIASLHLIIVIVRCQMYWSDLTNSIDWPRQCLWSRERQFDLQRTAVLFLILPAAVMWWETVLNWILPQKQWTLNIDYIIHNRQLKLVLCTEIIRNLKNSSDSSDIALNWKSMTCAVGDCWTLCCCQVNQCTVFHFQI